MVWGAFRDGELVGLEFISTRMTSLDYQQVLDKHLAVYLNNNPGNNFTFMHDNASIHASRSTRDWLTAHKIGTVAWPACSPDLNPIENVWGTLVRDVYKGNKQYSSVNELKKAIQVAWNRLQPTALHDLVSSMPRRLFEVGLKQGGATHY